VPVPVFLPTTLDSSEKVLAAIEELRGKAPASHLDAELLNFSGIVPEHDGKAEASDVTSEFSFSSFLADVIVESDLLNSETEARTSLPDVPYEPDLDIEIDFPRATEELDTENEFLLPPVFGEEYEEQPRPRSKKKVILGHQASSLLASPKIPHPHCVIILLYNGTFFLYFTAKSVKLKEDLLSHTSAELNYGLTHFVHEIRRPNGENYAPDSIYYLCLGIQE
ncbi:ZMYM2 protein, partial [Brachypteracias leptosomus]|nr:ZMYM2 protein [Brachypteracias leptosomus]